MQYIGIEYIASYSISMDPSSPHKKLLRKKLKRKKLVIVEHLDDEIPMKVEEKDHISSCPSESPTPVPPSVVPGAPSKPPSIKERKSISAKTKADVVGDVSPLGVASEATIVKEDGDEFEDIERRMVESIDDSIERRGDIELDEKIVDVTYEPSLPVEFTRDALERDVADGTPVRICCYRINRTGLKPFLEYYLYKRSKTSSRKDQMEFPEFPYSTAKGTSLYEQSSRFISKLFHETREVSFGVKHDGAIYLFFELVDTRFDVKERKRGSQWWWVMLCEIANYGLCCNFPISSSVRSVFNSFPTLLYLMGRREGSKHMNIIEIPDVGYHGTYYEYVPEIAAYGLRPSTINAMMGPYYYFGTYRKGIRYAGWTSTYTERKYKGKVVTAKDGRYIRGGMLRFAIFLGKMKVLRNHPQDREDYTDLVEERIRKNERNRRYEMMTLRMHDHNGTWTKDYDSIYAGCARLENGRCFMTNPEFVLKDYKQQTCLTTHELDLSTLKENWDNKYDGYYIV